MFLIALLTALAGELKVVPFNGEAFRFGLGGAIFLLLLLILRPASPTLTGAVTGVVVVVFRILEDALFGPFSIWGSLKIHVPAFAFYFLFGAGLHAVRMEKYKSQPLRLGAIVAAVEFAANGTEHIIRQWWFEEPVVVIEELLILLGVAVIRSYFVVGLYSSVTISEQQKRIEQMLKIGSGLYGEMLYLRKSMDHIEQITADSYDLYRKLKVADQQELSRQALHIAQQIHEVKKDSQRILAGLSKIYVPHKKAVMKLSEVLDYVIKANEKYSEMLEKKVCFHLSLAADGKTNQYIPLLTMLNNLVANAVEAIEEEGEIHIRVNHQDDDTCITVSDNGKGIQQHDLALIFEPGYTTKFNEKGVAATGIGLSHVKEIVSYLEGDIEVDSSVSGTRFHLRIPTKNIRRHR